MLLSSSPDDLILLCREDAASLSNEEADEHQEQEREPEQEETISRYVELEGNYSPELICHGRFSLLNGNLDPTARRDSVSWIIKMSEFFRFLPPTTYLAVNYMDRFLSRHILPQSGGWPVQLTSVACLSLAAKMEESLVPSLLDLQVEEGRFLFEPRTVMRMELLVLDALNWRLRAVTPFSFVHFFAWRADPSKTHARSLVSQATRIILESLQEIDFCGHCPSAMAAAAIMCSARDAASPKQISPESASSWCAGLTCDNIKNCYRLMRRLVCEKLSFHSISSSSSSNKRRKLSDCRRVDDTVERESRERVRETPKDDPHNQKRRERI